MGILLNCQESITPKAMQIQIEKAQLGQITQTINQLQRFNRI